MLPARQSHVSASPHLLLCRADSPQQAPKPYGTATLKARGGQRVLLLLLTNTRQSGLDPHHPNTSASAGLAPETPFTLKEPGGQNCDHR